MAQAVLLPGDGDRRVDARFELESWAAIHRANGEPAGKVLVTDISRNGFNMQSRWDFAAGEQFDIEFAHERMRSKIAWHDPIVGAYGCRFAAALSDERLAQILCSPKSVAAEPSRTSAAVERRERPRIEMRVPVTARRGELIECEVAILTNLSMSGFRMRTSQVYEPKQTIYIELAPKLLAEARILRHEPSRCEYAACFTFALAPALIDRLVTSHLRSLDKDN